MVQAKPETIIIITILQLKNMQKSREIMRNKALKTLSYQRCIKSRINDKNRTPKNVYISTFSKIYNFLEARLCKLILNIVLEKMNKLLATIPLLCHL